MAQLALARKWRPKSFDEVIGQVHVVKALVNALNQQKLHHAYLLTGTRGVGKTTLARILAKCLNCEQGVSSQPCRYCAPCIEIDTGRFMDLFEVDAASRTKVEDTRELLDNVPYAPTKGRYKIYLIDEVHMLSGHSFNALLKTLEEPPSHVKFILATTNPEKLPQTVLSRCLQFHLLLLNPEHIANHLQTILAQEAMEYEKPALMLLAKASDGSMRDALSLLDQAMAYCQSKVTEKQVQQMLGAIEPVHLLDLLHALAKHDSATLFNKMNQIDAQGVDFHQILVDLASLLHQLAIAQSFPVPTDSIALSIEPLIQQLPPEDIQLFYQITITGLRDMTMAPSPKIGFEMTMLRLLAFYQANSENLPLHVEAPKANPAKVDQEDTSTFHWIELLPLLNLQGASYALARNCWLDLATNDQIRLKLDHKHAPMLQAPYVELINKALNKTLGKIIKLEISLTTDEIETPNVLAQKQKQEQQNAAEQSINEDPLVGKIVNDFNASVIQDSISPK